MKCSVIGCENKKRFSFPSNDLMKNKWLTAIRRPNFKPCKNHGLCNEHFKVEDIVTESREGGYCILYLPIIYILVLNTCFDIPFISI